LEAKFFDREGATNEAYNIHDTGLGLSVDLMSYASYKRSQNGDSIALLNQQTLFEQSQATFSVFFKHFVHSNMSPQTGGWAYQVFGSRLNIERPVSFVRYFNFMFDSKTFGYNTIPLPESRLPNGDPAPKFEDVSPRDVSRTSNVTITVRVEVLKFNNAAFWTAIAILSWLVVTIIGFIALQHRHLGSLNRDVECIADILVLVAGSQRLLALVREKGMKTIIEEDKVHCTLGWFEDDEGKKRWGIEIAQDDSGEREALVSE
jgi:hypothetical protein